MLAPKALRLAARVLEDAPALLEASYRLRFQVYCLERRFLDPSCYPEGLERDEFDACSVHVGAVDLRGQLAGTARLVMRSGLGLPLFRHCTIADNAARLCEQPSVAEVSRMAVSRGLLTGLKRPAAGEVMMTTLKALYQVSKLLKVSHWLAATEKPLHRLLLLCSLPFLQVGPEVDYWGLVAPYLLDLSELDRAIVRADTPVLAEFAHDLEPAVAALRQSLAEGRWTLGGMTWAGASTTFPPSRPVMRWPIL